ncbi:MAG: glycosyltransferase family 2 protein [Methanobacteriota archaeon]|nr:MAG: glycosyltransferase family 2 protein [Euryarchaeota archaeon]
MTWDLLFWVLTVLGLLAFAATVAAIVLVVRFHRHVRASRVWDHSAFLPSVLVVVPCRGADPGLEENLDALLSQGYAQYRVRFCVDRLDDPAVPVIARVRARHEVRSAIAEAADLPGFSGKARALLGGLHGRTPADEVVAFVDSDIRPDPGFLRALIQPLALPSIGGTTGYRWYVPVRGGLWSVVRSAWNAAGLNIFFNDRYNFLWGGAWAIRRENLDRLDLEALWRGTLSEDLGSTAGLKHLGLRVQFVPSAVAPTFEDCNRAECVEWTDRQTAMVALWGRHIRNFAALTYGVFNGSLLLGLLCVALAGLASLAFLVPAGLFLFDVPVAVVNGSLRKRAIFEGSPTLAPAWRVSPGTWSLANLIVPWLITRIAPGVNRTTTRSPATVSRPIPVWTSVPAPRA